MAFTDMDRGCKVYIWRYGGLSSALGLSDDNVGHASLLAKSAADKFDYLSWWPKGGTGGPGRNIEHDRPGGYGAKMKDATTSAYSYHRDRARVTDKEREEKSAECKFQFTTDRLDYDAMLAFIKDLANGAKTCSYFANAGTWNVLHQNCSTTTAHCLRAGGADGIIGWPGHHVWNPDKVFDYCHSIVTAIGDASAVQTR